MFAHYVHDLSPFLIRFNENFGLRWYGLAYVAAFLIGVAVVRHLARKGWCDIPPDKVADFIIGGAIFGVLLGGRLGYMLFYDFGDFLHNPLIIIRVWDGGMSAHGGIIGLMLYTLWYSWKHKVAWRNIGDNLVVAAPIGLFLGRIANFINGELYGRETHASWGVIFPKALLDPKARPEQVDLVLQEAQKINPAWTDAHTVIENVGQSPQLREMLSREMNARHPSQIYEAFLEGALLFAILWVLRTQFRLRNGILTGAFFLGYAVLRIVGEFFREPDAALTGALTRGQFLSIFLVLIAMGFFLSAWLKPAYPKGKS